MKRKPPLISRKARITKMKIKDLFPLITVTTSTPREEYPAYNGFFTICNQDNIPVPWVGDISGTMLHYLDNMYAFRSNDKTVSSTIEAFIIEFKSVSISGTTPQTKLSRMIAMKYKTSWEHLYAITKAEYNPIANVESDETFTTITEHGHTVQNTGTQGMDHGEHITHTGTEQQSHGETITNTGTSGTVSAVTAANTENGIYGFNSSTAVPADSSTASNSGSSTRTDNLSEAHTGNDTRTDNLTEGHSGTDTRTDNLTETHGGIDKVTERSIREGNIGVTMTQQMLTAEADFWGMFTFWDAVFKDIDRELTLAVYDI